MDLKKLNEISKIAKMEAERIRTNMIKKGFSEANEYEVVIFIELSIENITNKLSILFTEDVSQSRSSKIVDESMQMLFFILKATAGEAIDVEKTGNNEYTRKINEQRDCFFKGLIEMAEFFMTKYDC